MYAIIKTGGKQYRVEPGATVRVEKLAGEAGESVVFDEVLLLADDNSVSLGRPTIEGATVKGQIVEQARGEKLIVYKFSRRKNYRRKNGHRQDYTAVKVDEVVAPS